MTHIWHSTWTIELSLISSLSRWDQQRFQVWSTGLGNSHQQITMDLNHNQEVQLRVGAHHLEDQHITSIDDMSRSQLKGFDVDRYLHEVIEQMKSLVEDSMPLQVIELESHKLCELLNAHVHSGFTGQSNQPHEPLITSALKKRLSNMFATPANAIRQKLQKSLTRGRHVTTIDRAVSSGSLSELLPDSQPSHANCSFVWEQDIADSLLANLPSQLSSLSKECEVTVNSITANSPTEKRVTRRWTCHRQSLAPSQLSPSSRRKKRKKSMRTSNANCTNETQDLIIQMENSNDTNVHNHTILVPDTQDAILTGQDKKKKKDRPKSNKTAPAHHQTLSQNSSGTGAVPKGTCTKYCVPHCKFNGKETAAAELLCCGVCMLWIHPACAGDSQDAWTCAQCRLMPVYMTQLITDLAQLRSDVHV